VTLFYPVPLALRPRFFLGTQLLKEDPNVVDEEVGRCLAGKVVASVVEIPGDDVFAVAFRKESDRLGDVCGVAYYLGDFGTSRQYAMRGVQIWRSGRQAEKP
jgi:hypothetical protein